MDERVDEANNNSSSDDKILRLRLVSWTHNHTISLTRIYVVRSHQLVLRVQYSYRMVPRKSTKQTMRIRIQGISLSDHTGRLVA
jgi:hypothetical protein